jgi:hypothetical protein
MRQDPRNIRIGHEKPALGYNNFGVPSQKEWQDVPFGLVGQLLLFIYTFGNLLF